MGGVALESTGTRVARRSRLAGIDVVASVMGLFNLAIAQPLLDLLGRSPEFFVVRDASAAQILLLVAATTLLAPLALSALPLMVGRVHARLGRIAHRLLLTGLTAALVIQVLKRIPGAGGAGSLALVGTALLVGAATAWLYGRATGLHSTMRFALALPVVVGGIFVFASPASALLTGHADVRLPHTPVEQPAPVVMVVFDELPLTSLMDAQGNIDAELFPHFARLADEGTWFRDTTTVAAGTKHALPALLDGRYAEDGELPIAAHHPESLFALLGGTYDIDAHEPMTSLCPDALCPADEPRTGSGLPVLASDLRVVLQHLVYPPDQARQLPPLDEGWGAFAGANRNDDGGNVWKWDLEPLFDDHEAAFDAFLDGIGDGDEPTLHFLHSILPHRPWRLLPSGQRYRPAIVPDLVDHRWTQDEWMVTQAYQRHLMQVVATDGLLGRLLDRLDDTGMYDRSLLVVTADHGIAMRPGALARGPHKLTAAEIVSVPLFVKAPFQDRGAVSDGHTETVDVLPTIADIVGIKVPWDVDGTSARAAEPPEPVSRQVMRTSDDPFVIGDAAGRKVAAAARKYELFGDSENGLDLFALSPTTGADLIGRSLDDLTALAGAGKRLEIARLGRYADLRVDQDPFPSMLTGRVVGHAGQRPTVVALAVNGVVTAVTRTYDDAGSFTVMLRPEAFAGGPDELTGFVVEGDSLVRTAVTAAPD